jgi:phage FluMu protein Com
MIRMNNRLEQRRCLVCKRRLFDYKGVITELQIKCPRCGTINIIVATMQVSVIERPASTQNNENKEV